MKLTQRDYATAAHCSYETAGRRLTSSDYTTGTHGTRYYSVAQAVTTLRPREVEGGAVAQLVASATTHPDTLWVGGSDSLHVAQRLLNWLPDDMLKRAIVAQHEFFSGVAHSKVCAPAVVENLGKLQMLYLLQPDVLSFVLTGTPTNHANIAPAFALVNNFPHESQAA